MNVVEQLNQEQMKANLPCFKVGDSVEVRTWVFEGDKKRAQTFGGIVIAKRNRGLHSSFTVRKLSSGEGVERVFHLHSPLIDTIAVVRRGDVRRAKLYYLRGKTGKAAKVKELIRSTSRSVG